MDKLSSMTAIAEKYGGIEKLRQEIKRKVIYKRDGEADAQRTLKKVFKPITEPLTVLQKTVATRNTIAATPKSKMKVEIKEEEQKKKVPTQPPESQPQPSTSKSDAGTSFLDGSAVGSQNVTEIKKDSINDHDDDHDDDDDFVDAIDEKKEDTIFNNDNGETNDDDNDGDDDIDKAIGSDVKFYLQNMDRHPGLFDNVYGVRKNTQGRYVIGSRPIAFDSTGRLHLDDEVFELTPGFLELLFKKIPRDYTDADRDQFKRIVTLTNSHRRHNHPTGAPLSNRG